MISITGIVASPILRYDIDIKGDDAVYITILKVVAISAIAIEHYYLLIIVIFSP